MQSAGHQHGSQAIGVSLAVRMLAIVNESKHDASHSVSHGQRVLLGRVGELARAQLV